MHVREDTREHEKETLKNRRWVHKQPSKRFSRFIRRQAAGWSGYYGSWVGEGCVGLRFFDFGSLYRDENLASSGMRTSSSLMRSLHSDTILRIYSRDDLHVEELLRSGRYLGHEKETLKNRDGCGSDKQPSKRFSRFIRRQLLYKN